jgi:lipopolysaccharide biosynthesis protein
MTKKIFEALVAPEKANENMSQQDTEMAAAIERRLVIAARNSDAAELADLEKLLEPETDPARADVLARRIIELKMKNTPVRDAEEAEEPASTETKGEDANGLKPQ